ncbi:MAG TPA: hypothetical protein PKE06_14370 [Flavilitoribacter sp.]|nr:hypothetical protein [Flavilitoribacter sp.]HMQ87359.1 hypothetical protein [Flavilitoribacter sp.]
MKPIVKHLLWFVPLILLFFGCPKPPVRLTPLPAAINVTVAPSAPPVDVVEDMLLKVTLFSDDGCILRQQTAEVRILHDI